jgi:hypothetical protein
MGNVSDMAIFALSSALTLLRAKSLLLLFGPMLLPKAIAYYRSIRATSSGGKPIRPIPLNVNRALTILFTVSLISLVSTFPIFSPENIFAVTQSRLQIPVDVLFTRLQSLRPQGLTDFDNTLRQKLVSIESRLLYFQYGPDSIANCLFCNSEDPRSYLHYSLTAVLKSHLFNLCVLGLVTSGLFVGSEGAIWRTTATIGAITVAAAEIFILSTYDHQRNARATRLEDVDAFFWKMRIYRGVAIAALDAVIGWFMYLSSTNRAFVTPLSPVERIEGTIKHLESARSKMNATGVMRNTIARDAGLRAKTQAYWVDEGRMMAECMEDREVVEGVNNALENRINIDSISRDANLYAENLVVALGKPDGST